MKKLMLTIVACAALVVTGCGDDDDSATEASGATTTGSPSAEPADASGGEKTKPKVTIPKDSPPKQLGVKDLEEGSGAEAKAGDEVSVQYVGVGYESGEEFDSSWSRNEPFRFTLGAGRVIPGWDQGVEGMKVGGRRELTIPPDLAYGEAGAPPAIGPNETLVFVIDLLEAG